MLQPSALGAALAGCVATLPNLEQEARLFLPLGQLRLWRDEG